MEMAQPGVLRKGSWKFRSLGSVMHASEVKIFKDFASSTGNGSLELGFICLGFFPSLVLVVLLKHNTELEQPLCSYTPAWITLNSSNNSKFRYLAHMKGHFEKCSFTLYIPLYLSGKHGCSFPRNRDPPSTGEGRCSFLVFWWKGVLAKFVVLILAHS